MYPFTQNHPSLTPTSNSTSNFPKSFPTKFPHFAPQFPTTHFPIPSPTTQSKTLLKSIYRGTFKLYRSDLTLFPIPDPHIRKIFLGAAPLALKSKSDETDVAIQVRLVSNPSVSNHVSFSLLITQLVSRLFYK